MKLDHPVKASNLMYNACVIYQNIGPEKAYLGKVEYQISKISPSDPTMGGPRVDHKALIKIYRNAFTRLSSVLKANLASPLILTVRRPWYILLSPNNYPQT